MFARKRNSPISSWVYPRHVEETREGKSETDTSRFRREVPRSSRLWSAISSCPFLPPPPHPEKRRAFLSPRFSIRFRFNGASQRNFVHLRRIVRAKTIFDLATSGPVTATRRPRHVRLQFIKSLFIEPFHFDRINYFSAIGSDRSVLVVSARFYLRQVPASTGSFSSSSPSL